MATFLEGVESITLWCSLVVLLPTVVLVLVAPIGRVWLASAALVGTATMMWARAGRLWSFESGGSARWIIGVAVVAILAVTFRRRSASPIVSVALGLAAGAIAGWLWQPCVGEHFAEVLNRAESDRVVSLSKMHAYVVGLFLPAILLVALPAAVPRTQRLLTHPRLRRAALAVAVLYGGAVAAGWYDDLVSELFRISSR